MAASEPTVCELAGVDLSESWYYGGGCGGEQRALMPAVKPLIEDPLELPLAVSQGIL